MADYTNLKKSLEEMLQKKKQDKEQEESMRREKNESDRNKILENISGDLSKSLQPVLADLAKNSKLSTDDIRGALAEAIQISVPEIKVPEIKMPDYPVFNVPQPKVTVNFDSSKIRVPEVVMPDMMDVRGMVKLEGIDYEHPLAVTLRDKDGKAVDLANWTTAVIGGSGKSDHFTVKGITNTVGVVTVNPDGSPVYGGSSGGAVSVTDIFGTVGTNVVNPDGRIKVELPTGSSGLTDTELRASSVPVVQASDVIFSTNVVSIFGSTITSLLNGDNRIPVSVETGGSGLTDTELRASSVPVSQVSDAVWSTSVTNTVTVTGTLTSTGAYLLNADGTYRDTMPISGSVGVSGTVTVDGSGVTQPVSGTVAVSGITNTIATANVDSSGIQYSGSNPFPMTLAVSNATSTINAVLVDSTGIYRGQVPVTLLAGTAAVGSVTVNGSLNSVISVGPTLHDAVDVGSAPQKVGGVAVTSANPTAVAGGDVVNFRGDDLGRQLTRPIQVRDLISTAYVSKTTGSTFGTETTLFAGATNTYHDLIYVLASNDSTAAIGVDIRGTTAGNILMHLEIPANSTTGLSLPVPLPAGDVGASWTIDLPDVTGTNVYVSALFSKEI